MTPARVRKGAGFLLAMLGACLAACVVTDSRASWRRYHFTEPEMGTVFELTYYAPDDATAERAGRAAFDRVEALNARFSDYEPESELMRLCIQPAGAPVALSPELFQILDQSQVVARATGGAFDITAGPLVRLWRQSRRERRLPPAEFLAEARGRVGFERLELDAATRTARLKVPGMKLDLGGIAKGYAADEALHILRHHGIHRALVAASGDLAVGDPPPGTSGWIVGLTSVAGDNPDRTIVVRNCGISTSGDTQQFLELGGVRYSHIVDPRTGGALTNRTSVTIIARNATLSDALATALCVLGPKQGMATAATFPGVKARIVEMRRGSPEETISEGFAPAAPK